MPHRAPMRDVVLIANPRAGQGGPEKRREALGRFLRLLEERGVRAEVRTTTGPRDATRLAAEAVRGGALELIVSGGDGTINEAIQGLVGLVGLVGADFKLALWPRGTANVLGRELAIPTRLDALADVVAAGKARRIHVGCATAEATGDTRYFLLMAGIGLDAAVVRGVRKGLKKYLGEGAYWYSGLERAVLWKPRRFTVEIDGVPHGATFAIIGKGPRYGGNLALTPRARMDRPEFEICLIDSVDRLRFMKLLPYARFGGVPEGLKGVSFFRTSQARAFGEGVEVQADGESIGALPMSFGISPHTIGVVTRGGK
jgi:YegS/Rv2252/BmrU family lipid kinase